MEEEKVYEEINLEKSDQVSALLEERHILDEELKMVIHNAETKGEKLYRKGERDFLSKMRIAEVTFYVEYSVTGGNNYVIHTAYSHRAEIIEE